MGGSCSEPIYVNVFYVLTMNHLGKHFVLGLRLGLRLVLGLEWTAGASALSVC